MSVMLLLMAMMMVFLPTEQTMRRKRGLLPVSGRIQT